MFWTFLGVKRAPREGLKGGAKKKLLLKVLPYLDNSNDTSFSLIGHLDEKLFDFWTFLDTFFDIFEHFRSQKGPQGGGLRVVLKKIFSKSIAQAYTFLKIPLFHRIYYLVEIY